MSNVCEDIDSIRILLVIPLYNNVKTVRAVVEKSLESALPLLVVNDGSTDGSESVFDELDINLINLPENRGKGAALMDAFSFAMTNGFSHLITLDADGQHDPHEIKKFVEAIRKYPESIIVGHRDFSKLHVPVASRAGRFNSNFWLWLCSGRYLPDTQSGFRAYPLKAFKNQKYFSMHYNFEIENLIRASWAGFSLQHLLISVVYNEETRKGSHFKPWLDNLRCSATFARLFFRSLFFSMPEIFEPRDNKFLPGIKILAIIAGVCTGALPLWGLQMPLLAFIASKTGLPHSLLMLSGRFVFAPFFPMASLISGFLFLYVIETPWNLFSIYGIFMSWLIGLCFMIPLAVLLLCLMFFVFRGYIFRNE